MRPSMKITLITVVCLISIFSIIFAVTCYMQNAKMRSAEKLNAILDEIKVGHPLSKVEEKLGQPMRILTKPEDMEEWGTIKDKKVIEKNNLYMFPYWGFPHKYILVYAGKDSNEVAIVDAISM